MKLYYRAVTQEGKTVKGIIEARDVKDAAFYLKKQQLIPIKIAPEKDQGFLKNFSFMKRVKDADVIFFTRQLASMLTSGLTLMQSMQIMKNQIQNPAMQEVVNGIIARIEDGKTFSSAIEKFPNIFSPIYVALIKASESSGLMDKVCTRLAENLEKQQKLKTTIKGAMMYPAIIVVMMIGVVFVMMLFVIPQLSQLYDNLNLDLPLPTKIIVLASKITTNYWFVVIIVVFAVINLYKYWIKKEQNKRFVDKYTLMLPLIGKLLTESMMVEFTRTFGLLIGTGSLVVDSLIKSADIVGNYTYRDAIMLVAKRVEKGIPIGDAMEASPLFPPILIQMVKIGEQTGKLDDSLTRVSEYFDREVELAVKGLTTAIEPIIMVVLAIGVGFLIIAIITPIYNLISKF